MKKLLLAIAFALLTSVAVAEPVQYYDTIEEAATRGLHDITTKSSATFYEWGGVIIQSAAGKFAALPPETSNAGDHVRIDDDASPVLALVGATIVATYHTHPCLTGYNVEYFSPPDLVASIFWHRITFMGDLCTGKVHEFRPGDKPDVEKPPGDGNDFWLTKGRIVGQFTSPHAAAI